MIPTHLLQTGNDIDRSVYEQILQFIRLRVTETYAFPPEIVRVDDITIATLGNFSASVGKQKDFQHHGNCGCSVVGQKRVTLQRTFAGRQAQGALCRYGTKQMPLPQGA